LLEIEKLVYGGDGLARDEGRVVFVPFSLPGERWDGETLVERSPDRIDPTCSYFTRCGGCHYQHMEYETQLRYKRAVLEETLARLGKLTPPAIEVISGEPWAYRNRVQFHFDRGQIGFHAAKSKKLVAVNRCPIASPAIQRTLDALREMRRDRRFPRFLESVELFTNETETLVNVLASERPVSRKFFDWCAERIPGSLLSALDYPTARGAYRVSHKSFFQVNRFLIDQLVDLAISDARGGAAIDLYAGVGLFTRPLTERFDDVRAVEVVRSAAADLRANAPRAEVVQQPAEDYLATGPARADFVLADPPRAGLGKRGVAGLLAMRPAHVAIVSCDPATLARDLNALLAGGYAIASLTLIDLFPQTFHIETVTHLVMR
jgi:23S rRNA (uracil1939-C5)-methyltransferase